MAKTPAQGTVLNLDIATVMTPVSQLISVNPPKYRSLDFEAKSLDDGEDDGTPREMTKRSEADAFEAEIWWDPALAVQAALQGKIDDHEKSDFELIFVNTEASELDFTVAGLELGVTVPMGDGLKLGIKGNVDGMPVLTV